MKNIVIISLSFLFLLSSCHDDDPNVFASGKGFFEYQLVDESGKPVADSLRRVVLSDAFFVIRQGVPPEDVPSPSYRIIDLYVVSKDFTGINASSIGGSYIKIQLADTLAFAPDQSKLLAYPYYLVKSQATLLVLQQPACLGLSANLMLTDTGIPEFEYEITGEPSRTVSLFDLQSGYHIESYGLFDDRIYNFSYVGPIPLRHAAF